MNEKCATCGTIEINNYCTADDCDETYSGWKPKDVSTRTQVLYLIDSERNRQDVKWGEQNHEQQLWVGILGEEFGEYCQAVIETVFDNGTTEKAKGGYDRMMEELTHVAAVAVNAMESLMRNKEEE